MNILSVTTLKCVLAEGIVHTVSNEIISQNHSLTYLLNITCSGCRNGLGYGEGYGVGYGLPSDS